MIKIKNYKAQYMFDLFEHLGPKRRKLLDHSWAGIFRSNVRHVLPVELLAIGTIPKPLFTDNILKCSGLCFFLA